jgi:hypothetical protein
MAIARCEKCGKPTVKARLLRGNVKPPGYSSQSYRPAGHPSSGVVCGKPGCENDALIWLKADEVEAYQRGQRVFEIHTQTAKVRLQ